MTGILNYSANNSGSWWLNDQNWLDLEAAGWTVDWFRDQTIFGRAEERWLGALATYAFKQFESAEEGVSEWERITGQYANDQGCNCCGQPHDFSFEDESGTHYRDTYVTEISSSWS